MGLAGVKKSTKIGVDPRNTKWINNQNGVGHKLLTQQGWTPGTGLGGSMEGRTINVKTTYKDDNAGIGCTPQHAQEWSGLSAFNDIFTRINSVGADHVAPIQDTGLRDTDRVLFINTDQQKVGLDVRFVKGETYTSDLSKHAYLESLGITISKEQRKLDKAARKAARAEKRELKKKSKRRKEVPTAVVIPPPTPSERPVHGRFASRAKYQRAKLGSRMDATQLAEILGVKAG